jgi:hypothetical protein
MRIVALIVCSAVVSASGVALAQNEPAARGRSAGSPSGQADDEVVVTGKRLAELRVEVDKARERAWDIFNDINTNKDFDVVCKDETRTFSHARQRVCQPRFEWRITGAAAREYMAALSMVCPADNNGFVNFQACMTGAYAQRGQARAQAVSGEAPGKRDQFSDEIFRIAGENDQFAQAILDFYAAQQKYDAARKPAGRPKGEDD